MRPFCLWTFLHLGRPAHPSFHKLVYTRQMTKDESYIPFSQRTGVVPIPPQLKVGEASKELRRLINYYIGLEIDRESITAYNGKYFPKKWERVTTDFHVKFLKQGMESYKEGPYYFRSMIGNFIGGWDYPRLFDLVEFFLQHKECSKELKNDLADAFVSSRAAYRIVDGYIITIGSDEQADAFNRALSDLEVNHRAARTHLIAAGAALRKSDWAGSIRESIHAVESMARRLARGKDDLAAALATLERQGHLHGSLKSAFKSLYGYTSNEEGVRHSLVFNEEAKVDETDALFMLGACASFVSYLAARGA